MIQVTRRAATPAAVSATAGPHHARLAAMARQVAASRRRTLWVAVAAGTALVVCGLAALDYFLELSTALRALGWGAAMLPVGLLVWRLRGRLRYAAADAAAAMETAWPEIGQRIRTSHDYQLLRRDVAPADPALVATLDSEAGRSVQGRPIEPLLNRWPLRLAWGGLAIIVMGWLAAALAVPEFRISTARAMLLPVGYTEVELEKLPDTLTLGERLNVGMLVRGRPLKEVKLWQRSLIADEPSEAKWTPVEVLSETPGQLVGRLTAVIEPLRSFELRIEAGPQRHPVHTVIVRQPLTIEGWTAQVEPPAYTGLPATDGEAEALSVPAGSSLQLRARYNRTPEQVTARADPEAAGEALQQTLTQQASIVSLTDVRETFSLRLHARSADGIRDESYPLRVRVVPDEPPLVVISSPAEDAEALPTQEVSFAVEARDDYGLSRIGIVYKINGGEEISLWERTLEERVDQMRHAATLPLEDMGLSFHDAITYYAFAVDTRPDPQTTLSELRFLDIRPFRREYEVQDAGSGNCAGECLALEKLIGEQRRILQRTFAAQRQRDVEQGPELAKEESELKEKLESLATALARAVGPIPSLETAVGMMALASDSLQEQDLKRGAEMEEGALADMILARKNLRKILKQGSSSSKQAKQIDRQESQQLRLPEKKRETQQEKLGDLRRKLEQLAKEQQQCAQAASQLSQAKSANASGQPSKTPARSSQQQPSEGDKQRSSEDDEQPSSKDNKQQESEDDKQQEPEPSEQQNTPSRVELVEQQIAAAKQASSLREEFASDEFGDLAKRRMQEVEKLIDDSARQLAAERDNLSAERAQAAASELTRLSEHLARRHDPDFDRQLADAQRTAQRLAADQRAINEAIPAGAGQPAQQEARRGSGDGQPEPQAGAGSGGSGLPEQQRRLAGRGEEFADLLDRMLAVAGSGDVEAAQTLTPALKAHPPAEAAAAMQAAADRLQAGQPGEAAREGQRAEEDLRGLAAALRDVAAERGDARLQQLVEAERRAGELMEAFRRAANAAEQSRAGARAQQFAESIQPLARGDEKLNDALAALQAQLQQQSGAAGGPSDQTTAQRRRSGASDAQPVSSSAAIDPKQIPEREEGSGTPAQTAFEGIRKLDVILQKRIQEAILLGSLQQTDQAVPTDYIPMIEEYYRTLSQDIE